MFWPGSLIHHPVNLHFTSCSSFMETFSFLINAFSSLAASSSHFTDCFLSLTFSLFLSLGNHVGFVSPILVVVHCSCPSLQTIWKILRTGGQIQMWMVAPGSARAFTIAHQYPLFEERISRWNRKEELMNVKGPAGHVPKVLDGMGRWF